MGIDISSIIGNASPVQWLASGRTIEREINFPRKDLDGNEIPIRIRILSRAQESAAYAEAHVRTLAVLEKKGVNTKGINPAESAPQLYNGILTEELLYQALINTDGTKLFPDSKTLALAVTGDELDVLLSEYQITRELHGPRAISLSEEALAVWCKAIEEDTSNALPFYSQCSPLAQVQLIQHLVKRYQNAPKVNSSS
jgi:hypothetical protein